MGVAGTWIRVIELGSLFTGGWASERRRPLAAETTLVPFVELLGFPARVPGAPPSHSLGATSVVVSTSPLGPGPRRPSL